MPYNKFFNQKKATVTVNKKDTNREKLYYFALKRDAFWKTRIKISKKILGVVLYAINKSIRIIVTSLGIKTSDKSWANNLKT